MGKVGSQQLCLLHSTWCLNWTVSALRFGKLPFAGALWNGSYGPSRTLAPPAGRLAKFVPEGMAERAFRGMAHAIGHLSDGRALAQRLSMLFSA